MKSATYVLVLLPLMTACASNPDSSGKPSADARIGQAATAPLNDLNLVRADIPVLLQAAAKAPYGPPAMADCKAVAAEVTGLDAVLGADLDKPPTAVNPSLVDRSSGMAGDAAFDALRRTAEGVVPFRGWVRKLSGAERYSKEVAAAIAAGAVRRAYLKGLGQAWGCEAPAAPTRPASAPR